MVNDVTHLYEEFDDDWLPSGQRKTQRFPVLSKGGMSSWDPETWSFEAWGAVDTEFGLSFDELRNLPAETQIQDFHYVTGWSKFDCEFEGVTFSTLADVVGVDDDAVHVMFHAVGGYMTNLSLDQCIRGEIMFVRGHDGEDLPADHGGLPRAVIPHKYAYKGARWASGVEPLTEPERGYWEKRDYSNMTNPWNEERYS